MFSFKWLDLNFQSPSAWTTEGSGVRTLWMAPKLRKAVLIYLPHGLLVCGRTALSPTGSCWWKQKFPIQSGARSFLCFSQRPTTLPSSQMASSPQPTVLFWTFFLFSHLDMEKIQFFTDKQPSSVGFPPERDLWPAVALILEKNIPVLWFNFL